jgi:hypothetical protein
MKRKRKIRHAGFPFHGGVGVFKKIIDNYDWGMYQIELTYLPCSIPTVNNTQSVSKSNYSLFRISDNPKKIESSFISTTLPPIMWHFVESVPGSKNRPA